MAGFTLSDGEDPPVEDLAPQLAVEADEGLSASPAPTTAVSSTQGAAPRRPSARSVSHAGGPFALPRRDFPPDEDIDMVDVSSESNERSAERKEEAPPSKRVQTMPTLPTPPVFRGSTAQDKQTFMKKYEAYCRQLSALETAFFRPFRMPVGACVEDERRRLIALFDICKPLDDITEEDWINYFWEGRIAGELDFDKVKALMSTKLIMDVQLADADSRVSKLAHEMYQLLEKENMEWMVEREPKKIVNYLTDALAPDQFRRTVKNELARESNKPLTKNVVAFIKWLRTSCKEYVRWEPRVSPKAAPTGKPPAKKPVPPPTKAAPTKTSPPMARRKRTCLKCGSEEHRVKDCPRAGAGEAEQLLREWREKRAPPAAAPAEPVHHVKALQLQEVPLPAGSGCLARLENVLDLDSVLLDSGADVNVASRGLIRELKDRGVAVQEETCSPCTLAAFDGSHFEVMKRVRFGAIQVQTTAGPLLLRNTPAWVFEHEKEKHTLVLSRPVMERLGYSVDAILAQACDTSREWDMQDLSGSDGGAIHLIREPSLEHAPPRVAEIDDAELRAATPDLGAAGDNAQAQVAAILADRVVEASAAGLAPEEVERLRIILQDYQDVFRVEFGRDPPVRVEPLRIRLREGATPVRSHARRYSPAHMAYLDQHVQELLDNGLAFINPSSRWASPPRIVSKSDPGTYRMTVDMRAVNARTEPILWPMPILEAALGLLEGSTCFFTLDWFRGYWQLPLDPASQEMFSIMTHRGIITPTRVSMGGTDSVAYCQHVVEEVFRPVLYKGVLAWLDDILGYAADPVNLLEVLERVLAACRSFGLKLHPGKCHFFLKEAKWCGKFVSKEGIRHSPTRVQGLVEMPDPTNAGQLQQLMCAINWMRQHIPHYATLAAPLLAVVDAAAKKAGSRKSKQISKVSLSEVGWNREHVDALNVVRGALMKMVPLAHPDPAQAVCLFCDASQDSWGAICTQVSEQDLSKPLSEQEHLPLAFLSGRFTGAQLKRPTIEKEAYAIVESAKRLEYLLLRPGGFHLFTDHRNLVYMFNPFAADSGMQRYQADKLQRWSMVMTTYRYVIEHARGEDNIWADLLSRWGSPPTPMDPPVARMDQVAVVPAVSPLAESSFEWPTFAEICAAQQLQESRPEHVTWNESKACFVFGGDRVWIPDNGDLVSRICVVAHAGGSGHRGERTTASAISAWCWWPKLREDVSQFVKSCIHCVATRDGREPRPYGPAIHATAPNEVLHFDYLTLPEDEDSGNKYILVLKDDFSGFVELWTTANPDASSCAAALQAWFNRYGVVKQWVSDQGTHFKNQVIDELAKAVGANHHFTTAYCPWANGTVEVVNRLLLKCMRALLSERRLSPAKWESIVGMVQAALNQQPSGKLGGRAPVTAFMGLPATTPLSTIFSSGSVSEMDEGALHAKIQEHLSSTAEALEAMHRDVAEIGDQRRMQARARRAARAKPPNFGVGDFVLVASVVAAPNKLSIKWQGPKRVTKAISDWIFEVEDLVQPHVTSTHHVSRLRFYAESAREVTEDLLQHALHAQGGHCVEEFRGVRHNTTANQWQVEVKWLGLDELENTWESYASLQTDVPVLLARYCEAHKEEPQFAEMLQAVSRPPRARLQRSRQSGSQHSTEHLAHPTRPTRHSRRR